MTIAREAVERQEKSEAAEVLCHWKRVENSRLPNCENGKKYYPLDNSPLNVPRSKVDQPSREYLAWHNEHVFRG